jgi:hypothetical protein
MPHLSLRPLVTLAGALLLLATGTAGAANTPPTCDWEGGVDPYIYDLMTPGYTTTIGGAIYTAVDTNGSVGTGQFPAFVKIQGNDCIQGYNTDGTKEFETQNAPLFTFLLSTMDKVTVGGTDYVEFHLDINQDTNNPGLSLDNVQLFVDTSNTLTGWSNCSLGGAACIYDMDASSMDSAIELNYLQNKGSGNGYDMQLLVPVSVFGSVDASQTYVYLYSAFGGLLGDFAENDGFEEWAYRRCPEGQVCWTTPNPDPNPAPEPGTLALLAIAMVGGALSQRRRLAQRFA